MAVALARVFGSATIRRTGRREILVGGGRVLATMGRPSWLRIYLGSGQKILLPDGATWRLVGTQCGRAICPLVVSDAGRLAMASPGVKNYLITCRDSAYILNPGEKPRWGRAMVWTLREHETDVAEFHLSGLSVEAFEPIPVAAVVLCFAVVRLGLPGEGDTGVPRFHWG